MSFREVCASLLARITSWMLVHLFHRSASQLPGVVARTCDPHIIRHSAQRIKKGSIVVCGTNGKTTTNNLICALLERTGAHVACNRVGANMPAGIAAALLSQKRIDWACLEVDELSTISVVPELQPTYFVLLNLFRDQLDRVGEMDRVQDTLVRALVASPKTILVVCADDPLSMGVAWKAQAAGVRVRYFGVLQDMATSQDRVAEARFCQLCGAKLLYHTRTYAQLGDFYCPACEFRRPHLDYAAHDITLDTTGLSFKARPSQDDMRSMHIHTSTSGLYMVYNLMALASIALELGISEQILTSCIENYQPENGRLQHFMLDGTSITLNLAKNPTGFNQNISLLQQDTRSKYVYICINDHDNDGCDVSWIWDVDFERLHSECDLTLLCGGSRAHDMQVRLKYAGFDAQLAATIDEALHIVNAHSHAQHSSTTSSAHTSDISSVQDKPLYVLTNYSALWPVKARLEELSRKAVRSKTSGTHGKE